MPAMKQQQIVNSMIFYSIILLLSVNCKHVSIPIKVFGDGSAGDPEAVAILLHHYGGTGSGAGFVPWFPRLAAAGYRCLAPSFPGFGGTPGKSPSKPDPDVLGTACLNFT